MTGHWNMENQNALSPTRIQLKHSLCLSTLRLFQRVVSGWKATQKKYTSSRPGQNVSNCESTPWPWVAEYGTHLKHCGTCTIIVVTTIVRFSTEDESLLYGRSIIFTKRSNSFQYPICKKENTRVIIKTTAIFKHINAFRLPRSSPPLL